MSLSRIRRAGLPIVAAIAASAAVAAPAIAAPAIPIASPAAMAGLGTFKTWPEAQKAAGFKLMKPGTSYRLPNIGHIVVSLCEVPGKTSKRIVSDSYGSILKQSLSLVQDNASGPCFSGASGTYLGKYKIHGVTAVMYGYCGFGGAPSCSSTNIEIWLSWQVKKVYFRASAHDEARSRLVHFASVLKRT
jgi:hypothetical protein